MRLRHGKRFVTARSRKRQHVSPIFILAQILRGKVCAPRADFGGSAPPFRQTSAGLTMAQSIHQLGHILRQRTFELQLLARHRVFEAQGRGVQRLAGEAVG